MRMLFDYYETDRLIVCMDPGNLELLQDFESDRSVTRMLEVQCDFTLDYMIGHAMRVGLAGEQTSVETLGRLWPTIRNDMNFESDALRDAEFEHLYRMHESATVEENAKELANFPTVSHEKGARSQKLIIYLTINLGLFRPPRSKPTFYTPTPIPNSIASGVPIVLDFLERWIDPRFAEPTPAHPDEIGHHCKQRQNQNV